MGYAILQAGLDIPPVDKLKRAFRSVPFLTDIDAYTLARDGYGILVKHLTSADASALQGALRVEGVETFLVEEDQLPVLPQSKLVHRSDCLPEALLIYDPLGRPFPLEWQHLMLIAAGRVQLRCSLRVESPNLFSKSGRNGFSTREERIREEVKDHWILELVLNRAVMRYILDADKFNFQYLGERRARSVEENFKLLVQDLVRYAPAAACNRGAFYLKQNQTLPFSYPSQNAFNEELIWLLWRMGQTQTGNAD
jgi:hypothetical protein